MVYLDAFSYQEINYLNETITNMGKQIIFIQTEARVEVPKNSLLIQETFQDRLFSPQKIIESAMRLTDLASYQMILVSKDHLKLKSAVHLPISTVLFNENPHIHYNDIGNLPDLKLGNIQEIPELFKKTTGYFSEVFSTYLSQTRKWSESGYIFKFFAHSEATSLEIISGGRYFGPKHSLYESSQLSKRIGKSKNATSQDNLFYKIFLSIIKNINDVQNVNGITRVPSRPEKKDRLAPIVNLLSKKLGISDLSSNLSCKHNYPPHKNLKKEQRFINVKDQFSASLHNSLEHVVLIDDVFTTGATMLECAKELHNVGIKKVTGLVLGVNQFADEFMDRSILCEKCGGKLHLILNNKNYSAFYGCAEYQKHGCPTHSYGDGLNRMVTENLIDLVNTNEEF
ncbi:ComF family protein [Bacillus safensis]|uniref:ComF family protein n=1 Tax=Bacillus safensis TaxID=561879 RepID=UPI0018E18ED6|nr:ComF family protein [Bacillus safensis]MBI1628909.1 ComF family protein [Bacillus safensis]